MSIEAMKQMVEALSKVAYPPDAINEHPIAAALRVGRQAIAEAEKQEPVDFEAIIEDIETIDCMYRGSPSYEHCPYKIRKEAADTVRRHASYYTHPQPKREWIGLTVNEIHDALRSVDPETQRLPKGLADFAYALEAKLKEKNNG